MVDPVDHDTLLNAPEVDSGQVTTTTGASTLVSGASFVVAEGETILYEQKSRGVRTDVTAGDKGYGSFFTGVFRRPAAGSTTAIGTITTVYENANTPQAYSADVDLTTNTITPEVTGAGGQTVSWDCDINILRVS